MSLSPIDVTGLLAQLGGGKVQGATDFYAQVIAPLTADRANSLIASVNGLGIGIPGAVGDGIADDRAAIQAAIDAVHAAGGGEVYFPAGTYRVTQNASLAYCLNVSDRVRLRGAPGATVQKDATLAGTSGKGVAVVNVQGNGVTIEKLAIDGNRQKTTYDPNFEHQPGVFVQSSDQVTFRDVEILHCGGDAIQLYNAATNVVIAACYLHDNNRQGLSLTPTSNATPTTGVRVVGCRVVGNAVSAIDCEPSGTGFVQDVSVTGSYLDVGNAGTATYAISLAAGNDWSVTGNRVYGSVTLFNTTDIAVSGNEITDTLGSGAVFFNGKTQRTSVTGNVLRSVHAIANASCVRVVATAGGNMTFGGVVSGNLIDCSSAPATIIGVMVNTANDLVIADNNLVGPGLASATGRGIHLRATETAEAFRSVVVTGNRILNFGSIAIAVAGNSTAQLLSAQIANNFMDDTAGTMTTGVSLDDGLHALQAYSCLNNVAMGGVSTVLTGTPAGSSTLINATSTNTGWVVK